MGADDCTCAWLLLLSQLPRAPSSARVALWRRLRAAGATMMVNSAWVLPDTPPHAELFGQLREGIERQGGTAFVLSVPASSPEATDAIVGRFRADRDQEYDEFAERGAALLQEITREATAGKYTFAELEESEQDLEKLARWLAKIQQRDFFPGERGDQASAMLARCRAALESFSQAVYAAEGLAEAAGPAAGPVPPAEGEPR
jgi:Protein ChrB, N-terminal